MILEAEIREKLSELLSGRLDLESFEDWLVQHSWNMHLDSDPAAQDLAAGVELALAEHSSGHLSDDELRQELHALPGQVVASPRSAVSR
jgi:hypothetical protein